MIEVGEMEKPLHVRVAEVLGCKPIYPDWEPKGWRCMCKGMDDHRYEDGADFVAEYATDWSATGPLIERLRIDVDAHPVGNWTAMREPYCEAGHTPLEAACNLILALHAAGKLPR